MPDDMREDEKDRNFVTALARGLDVLRAFQPGDTELTNTDFAERTGLPKPTVSRLTHTLCVLDYLVNDTRKGTYRLGAGVLQLGFGVMSGLPMTDRAGDVLRSLRDGPNKYITAAVGERHRLEMIYLAVERTREQLTLAMQVGSCLPLFGSAMGRAVLASAREEELDAIFALASVERPEQESELHRIASDARAEWRADGFCRGFGDWRADVNGIAVPVRIPGRGTVYGLNVGGPSFHVSKRELEREYAPRLHEAARILGDRG